ncbi:hypothetical protein MXMO3_00793 [Maritalea myrionectae]|uniref:DUF2306 domain-containing protein n=1 Tax=Maritalea myrionectae TaxID=454601 RepID=A0A2R4MBK8_9HYPH|nr:DUF2306 domain-containing protein [Maritalea myrionectae]AVX03325.1 hypothetical protein MXMO3_00793 [Maritalea myrionectae]
MSKIQTKPRISNWRLPLFLFIFGLVNIAFGTIQLSSIAIGPAADGALNEMTSPQYFITPVPVIFHIVCGIFFNVLAPLQFVPALRKRVPKFHRWSGRLLLIAGLGAAASGMYMNQFFPAFGTGWKYAAVLIFSFGMIASLLLGLRAILNRDVKCHNEWMMRAVMISLGPATQRLLILPIYFATGQMSILMIEIVMWAGFLINIAVGEMILRSHYKPRKALRHAAAE